MAPPTTPGGAGDQDGARIRGDAGDADHDGGDGHDAVVGAQNARAEPVEAVGDVVVVGLVLVLGCGAGCFHDYSKSPAPAGQYCKAKQGKPRLASGVQPAGCAGVAAQPAGTGTTPGPPRPGQGAGIRTPEHGPLRSPEQCGDGPLPGFALTQGHEVAVDRQRGGFQRRPGRRRGGQEGRRQRVARLAWRDRGRSAAGSGFPPRRAQRLVTGQLLGRGLRRVAAEPGQRHLVAVDGLRLGPDSRRQGAAERWRAPRMRSPAGWRRRWTAPLRPGRRLMAGQPAADGDGAGAGHLRRGHVGCRRRRRRCRRRGRTPAAAARCRRRPAAVPCRRRPWQHRRGAGGRCCQAATSPAAVPGRAADAGQGPERTESMRPRTLPGALPAERQPRRPGPRDFSRRQQRSRLGCQQSHSPRWRDSRHRPTAVRARPGRLAGGPRCQAGCRRPAAAGFRPVRRRAPARKRAVAAGSGGLAGVRTTPRLTTTRARQTRSAIAGERPGKAGSCHRFSLVSSFTTDHVVMPARNCVHHAARKIARLVHTTSSSGRRPAS